MDNFLYKIIDWLQKLLHVVGRNASRASSQLNFIRYQLDFGERDDDIYIVTYPKSGTTLTQMVVYQLTTDGNMNFDHIYEVSPWLRNDAYKRNPIKDVPSPRIIKSHDGYKEFRKGIKGRFIYIHRNPKDVAVSQYHQRLAYGSPDLKFEEFFEFFINDYENGWFKFTQNWLRNNSKHRILYLSYNELTDNKVQAVMRIAHFLDIPPNEIPMERILERSSFKYMKANESKFGEQPVEPVEMIYDQFIRSGKTGSGEEVLTEDQKQIIAQKSNKYLGNLVQVRYGKNQIEFT